LLESPPAQENPLLRSGLILAGVKQQRSGEGEDGVLTALEMAGLNLWGTKLVVLSACETGLGDVRRGEGLYGLRRALVLAGSESQVISLWKVSDAGTRDLMTAFYTRIQKHQGRTEALRNVQMAMLEGTLTSTTALRSGRRETTDIADKSATKNYRHPYYWAAFIQSGDWRNMDDR
jgi:CHAT domain-containing protein